MWAVPNKPALPRDDLIKTPQSWKELLNHPMCERFLEAAHTEVKTLIKKGTWIEIGRTNAKTKPLPLKWVLTYKFDQDGFLDRCKA